tara:strand:+ start:276 stop:1274 length:999 start_codon:yes stop_codon:yes gene_type:complete
MNKYIDLNEKILVAGGSGMVGSAIVRKLLDHGYGQEQNGGKVLSPTRKELDLTDNFEVENWFRRYKPTIVIIAAAKVGGIMANKVSPAQFLFENIKIQTNLIENSWRLGIKRLLFLGSSCIYPKYAEQPIKEESLLSGALENTNEYYAIAKIAGIKMCQSLRIQYGFDAISLMPTNLYGPKDNYHKDNSHVMASFIRKFSNAKIRNESYVTCWGTGNPLREFLHVDDLAEAVIYTLEIWNPDDDNAPLDDQGNPLHFLNVGTGKDLSIKELANKISNIIGFKGNIKWDLTKPDGTPKKQLNIKKISELGWSPKINLDDGIINTIKNYKNNFD